MMNKFGDHVLSEKDVIEVLYNNPDVNLNNLNIIDVEKFNDAIDNLYLSNNKLVQYNAPDFSIEEFDKLNQQTWHMPQKYKELDIAEYLLYLCETDVELQRVGSELLEFQKLDFFDALRFLKYFVDIMRNNNIVGGVGRGSSVASYVLFLLGIHKINSIKYNLSPDEFFK